VFVVVKEPQLAAADFTTGAEIPEPPDEMSFRLGAVYTNGWAYQMCAHVRAEGFISSLLPG
jgi:hypothetical protein